VVYQGRNQAFPSAILSARVLLSSEDASLFFYCVASLVAGSNSDAVGRRSTYSCERVLYGQEVPSSGKDGWTAVVLLLRARSRKTSRSLLWQEGERRSTYCCERLPSAIQRSLLTTAILTLLWRRSLSRSSSSTELLALTALRTKRKRKRRSSNVSALYFRNYGEK